MPSVDKPQLEIVAPKVDALPDSNRTRAVTCIAQAAERTLFDPRELGRIGDRQQEWLSLAWRGSCSLGGQRQRGLDLTYAVADVMEHIEDALHATHQLPLHLFITTPTLL